jgi:hypothetical protein
VTKRSGVYGATLAEADTAVILKMDSNGQLIQVCFRAYCCNLNRKIPLFECKILTNILARWTQSAVPPFMRA